MGQYIVVVAADNPSVAGTHQNVAAASLGGVATASSFSAGYSASGVVDGDRRGIGWGTSGGWQDATPYVHSDWVEVAFAAPSMIERIDVFFPQDSASNPVAPTFAQTGAVNVLKDFEVQYWDGTNWRLLPGGAIGGNSLIRRVITFSPLMASKIRVISIRSASPYTRIVEIEAWQSVAPINGVCGSANNSVLASAPVSGLCASGVTSAVTGIGPWTWTCAGMNGGASAPCTASSYDTTPDSFSFASYSGVRLSTSTTSAPITVSGINAPSPIRVSGGTYSIGCTGTFTSAESTVTNGQTVCVNHTSAANLGASISTTLMIGGATGVFTSTTLTQAGCDYTLKETSRQLDASGQSFVVLGNMASGCESSVRAVGAGFPRWLDVSVQTIIDERVFAYVLENKSTSPRTASLELRAGRNNGSGP
ncbi:MAG TPA: discoidin domain-containing protein, partial [Casimicrobium sp.]|nr:discoidin domain-containing protein [Casimicrobium sp.]